MIELYQGDCLEIMPQLIERGIKIDSCITDPPYGKTACKWDVIIPFAPMWDCLKRLRKDRTPIVLFGSEPFSSLLRVSNLKEYHHEWIWDKKSSGNYLNAKKMPLKKTENIMIFSKSVPFYYPQMVIGKLRKKGGYSTSKSFRKIVPSTYINDKYYPYDIINISNANHNKRLYPNQKPVSLIEYLIKTYTKESDLVLDFAAGSGTTGEACRNLNRNCILIEKEDNACLIIEKRLNIERIK